MSNSFYKVYITCMTKDSDGCLTKDYMLAKQLYRKLEQKGIHVFLMGKCSPDDRTEAIDLSGVLIIAGVSKEALLSDEVRNDYDDFIAGVELSGKRVWRVFNYLRGITRDDLPDYLSAHRSFAYYDTDELVRKIEQTLNKEAPKSCVSDEDEQASALEGPSLPESLPDSAESAREYEDEDDWPVRRGTRARRVPQSHQDEMRMEQEAANSAEWAPLSADEENTQAKQNPSPVIPPMPSSPKNVKPAKPVKVQPAKINKVDFSVVAPDEVKPGKSAVIDLLMYTRSQRGIVKRTIEQAKEKSSETARSVSSVSVRQGSRVTALLFSDDIELTDCEQTLIWNGDALDFQFRVTPPEGYSKKEIDFGCSVLFDGIQITRLYFTVAVHSGKKAAVRFVRKDCRRAFVSYSHKDKIRVVEQLCAIQEAAPKLRFWMDNQSMTAGDMWRSAIASAIREADVFLLFWSVSARESSEVRKEWEYALKLEQGAKRRRKNGARFISPVPLDKPSDCPPPEELGDLHFGDPSFDSDIEDIDNVSFWSESAKHKNIRFF